MPTKPCGLITRVPPALLGEWAVNLSSLLKGFRPAAIVLDKPSKDELSAIIVAARQFDLAVLVADDLVTACNGAATGVYFAGPAAPVAKAREALGSGAVIGAACALSRHAAMEHAEAGADFITFDASDPDLLDAAAQLSRWWDEVTGIPAALAFGASHPQQDILAKARPDFLLVEEKGSAGESLTFATQFGLQSQD